MVEKGWVAGVLGDIPHVINLPKYQGSLSCLGCLNLVSIGGDPQRAAINDGWFCRLCPSTCLDDNKGALFTFRIPDQEEIGSWLPRFLFKLHTPWFPTHLPSTGSQAQSITMPTLPYIHRGGEGHASK